MNRCPHCGHDPAKPSSESGFMSMQTQRTDWFLVLHVGLFVASVILVLAAAHAGVIG